VLRVDMCTLMKGTYARLRYENSACLHQPNCLDGARWGCASGSLARAGTNPPEACCVETYLV
jgi:hypothetical protein